LHAVVSRARIRGHAIRARPGPNRRPASQSQRFDVVTVDNLSKASAIFALRGASFSIRRGEILGLIGPNGSSKTMLFGASPASHPPLGAWSETRPRVTRRSQASSLFVPTAFARGQTSRFAGRCASPRRARRVDSVDAVSSAGSRRLPARDFASVKGEHRRVVLAIGC
jgi:hypothetical protein